MRYTTGPMALAIVLAMLCVSCAVAQSKDGIVYGVAAGEQLTMDYFAPAGRGLHPVVIIIHGGGFIAGTSKSGSEGYGADSLARAGILAAGGALPETAARPGLPSLQGSGML